MTNHLPSPLPAWTSSDAYRLPMVNIQPVNINPPEITEVRRPHRSAKMKAGMEIANMARPETPDARKDAVAVERPACANRVGAY